MFGRTWGDGIYSDLFLIEVSQETVRDRNISEMMREERKREEGRLNVGEILEVSEGFECYSFLIIFHLGCVFSFTLWNYFNAKNSNFSTLFSLAISVSSICKSVWDF